MRYRSSKYGERTNLGTRTFAIIPIASAIILLFIFAPLTIPLGLGTLGLILIMNQVCKRRRKNPKTGKWEWCPPQEGVSYLWPKDSKDPSGSYPKFQSNDKKRGVKIP